MADTLGRYSASIMIVDDQPINVRLLEKTLQHAGYSQIYGFTDPVKAIDFSSKNPVDLILLDLNMPEVNGFEFLKRLRDHSSDESDYLSVIVITAQTDSESRIQALEQGARDFLNKPFDRLELLTRIQNIIDIRLMHNALRDQNKILERRVRERTAEIEITRLEVIRRLGRAAEYRDNETGLHIVRMSNFAALIARALGQDKRECEFMLNASPMHDIGKIGIPDSILLKQGKFSKNEWEVMKTHVVIGAEMLSGENNSQLLNTARTIAISHHEKWDGTGYPYGLSGASIPIEGRIVAIADVFDALTSERPYKVAWSIDRAVEYVRQQRGLHFDPDVVDAFFAVLPDVIKVKRDYAEPVNELNRDSSVMSADL